MMARFRNCKRSIFGLKKGKKAQCVSNRCKDLVKRKKYFRIMDTLRVLNDANDVSNKCPSKQNSYLFGTVFNFRTRTLFFYAYLPFLSSNPRTNDFAAFMSEFNISITYCKRTCLQLFEMRLL